MRAGLSALGRRTEARGGIAANHARSQSHGYGSSKPNDYAGSEPHGYAGSKPHAYAVGRS